MHPIALSTSLLKEDHVRLLDLQRLEVLRGESGVDSETIPKDHMNPTIRAICHILLYSQQGSWTINPFKGHLVLHDTRRLQTYRSEPEGICSGAFAYASLAWGLVLRFVWVL